MFILKTLTHRPIRLLWGGQVLSAVGDELYKVALIWVAVGLVGARAGLFGRLAVGFDYFVWFVGRSGSGSMGSPTYDDRG